MEKIKKLGFRVYFFVRIHSAEGESRRRIYGPMSMAGSRWKKKPYNNGVNVCIHDFDDVKEESNKAASNDKHLLQE